MAPKLKMPPKLRLPILIFAGFAAVAHFLPVLVKPKPQQVDTETTETKSSKNRKNSSDN